MSPVVVAILVAACANQPVPTPPSPSTAAAPVPSASAALPTSSTSPAARMIEQPAIPPGLDVAPDSARVDIAMPTFSNPTEITNPLFPVSSQASVLMLGHVDDKPFRTEVTLLPYTRIVEWQGGQVTTAVSQYVAYLDGKIQEVAYDLYAQADDGSVWYFGEDVFDFADGAIVTTEGTWQAGRDGPAAMIMPGQPQVGDVYRTENAPGLVFEQVTVQSVDEVLDGPLGPVQGGLVARELHADGATEDKQFAPGYGEFSTSDGADLEALALAVSIDGLGGPVPPDLAAITDRTRAIAAAVEGGDWAAASDASSGITAAWDRFRTSSTVPDSVAKRLGQDLDALATVIEARDADATKHAALDVRQSGLDLQLRHRPVQDVDLDRFSLWLERLQLDVAAESAADARADVFALDYIRDRLRDRLDAATAAAVNAQLGELQIAVVDDDLDAMATAGSELLATVAGIP
jgi:hypothetical protein